MINMINQLHLPTSYFDNVVVVAALEIIRYLCLHHSMISEASTATKSSPDAMASGLSLLWPKGAEKTAFQNGINMT